MYNPDSVRVGTHKQGWRNSNPGINSRQVIGTFTLTEPKEYTKLYEVAAWWTKILVQPGSYDVTSNGYWAFVSLPGKIVDEYMPSMFGGVAYGKPNRPENIGKDATEHIQTYLYSVAALMANPESNWEPAENVEPYLTGWVEHRYTKILEQRATPTFGVIIHENS